MIAPQDVERGRLVFIKSSERYHKEGARKAGNSNISKKQVKEV
jgi:hypothetical protein